MEENEKHVEQYLKHLITRRQAIKAGGLTALGLAFSKPVIKTIYPNALFASSYGGGSSAPSPGGGSGGGGGPIIMWMQIKKLLADRDLRRVLESGDVGKMVKSPKFNDLTQLVWDQIAADQAAAKKR